MADANLPPTPSERGLLGSYLWDTRKSLGWSLRLAEEKSGVSNAYISQIENGTISKPSPTVLLKLANGYEAPYKYLMELAGHITATEIDSKRRKGALPTSTLPDLKLSQQEEKEVREFIAFIRMRNRKSNEK